jgi:hypothetical protein
MKLEEAMQVINAKSKGYRVIFEWVMGTILSTDYFPDRNEPPIETEEEAWRLAILFAENTVGKAVNIYVCHANTYMPVRGYEDKIIKNR